MKKTLKVRPFADFWINCYVNDVLSILTTIEPSYKKLSFINSYNYTITGISSWWRELDINPSKYLWDRLSIGESINIYLKQENIIDEIRNKIDNNRYILVLVDLYYWLKNSLNWNNNHYHHYVLITGYDDDKKMIYSISDNIGGYSENEIPYERFIKALVFFDNEHHGKEFILPDNIPAFQYCFYDIFDFARKINEDIKKASYMRLWILPQDVNISLVYFKVTRIADRQKGNEKLFGQLYEDGFITSKLCVSLSEMSRSLYNMWSKLKGILIRAHMKNNDIDLEKLNILSRNALKTEYDMWDAFENSVKSKYNIFLEKISCRFNLNDLFGTIVELTYRNVKGKLMLNNSREEFIINTDSEYNYVRNVEIINNKIILYTDIPYYFINDLSDAQLFYIPKAGRNQIIDNENHYLLVINGERLDTRLMTPYICELYISEPFSDVLIKDLDYKQTNNVVYQSNNFANHICAVTDIYKKEHINKRIVFFRFYFNCKNSAKIKIHIGYSCSIKVWVNTQALYSGDSKILPIGLDICEIDCNSLKGNNEVVIAQKVIIPDIDKYDEQIILSFLGVTAKIEYYDKSELPFFL